MGKILLKIPCFRRYVLKKQKKELIKRKEYLLSNGFNIVFNGVDKIQQKINDIDAELKK